MALGSLASAFLGSLQACVAVLLTIGYGVVATQYQILRESSARDISKLAVKMFLPALLLSNVGEQLSPKNVWRYVPILGKCFVSGQRSAVSLAGLAKPW